MKYLRCLFLLFIVTISCSKSDNYKNLTRIEVSGIKGVKDSFSMFTHIHTAQLENRDENIPILKLVLVVFNEKYIIGVSGFVDGFAYVWSRDGHFIGRIGALGKGPGEYQGINDIYFESESEVGIIDAGLARVHVFSITEDGIKFNDFIDMGNLFNSTPSQVYIRGEKRILFFSTGYHTPAVIVTNKKWEKEKEFHFLEKKSVCETGNALVADDRIYLTDGREGFDFLSHTSFVFTYSFEGKLLHKYDTKNKGFSPLPLKMDIMEKILIVEHEKYSIVYDLEWKKIHKFQNESFIIPQKYNIKPYLFFTTGERNEYCVIGELPKEKNKSLILHFFERRIPE